MMSALSALRGGVAPWSCVTYLCLNELVGLLDVPEHDEDGPLHGALPNLREEEVVRHDALLPSTIQCDAWSVGLLLMMSAMR